VAFAFEATHDATAVRSILLAELESIADDFTPSAERYEPPQGRYLIAREDGEILGFWFFVPQTHVCWEAHIVLTPTCRGKRGIALTGAMFAWLWAHTECRRLVAAVPVYHRRAVRFCALVGMERIGVNRRAFLRRGRLHDTVLFGISPPEESICP
jgi:RimJ/RimL family protein N-acetyltransferase